MSDAPKPNRDLLKLAVLLLTTVLTSGGVQRWLNADTEVKMATVNTIMDNRTKENASEATWAVGKVIELEARVRKLEER
jgi:hypothetical protein